MRPVHIFLAMTAAFPVLYLIDARLFLIYLLIWADKLILGMLRPLHYLGIELTTLATVLAVMFFGTVASFITVLVLFTVLQSLRHLLFPFYDPEYPLFVPNPDGMIYASGAIVAGAAAPLGFATSVMAVIIVKYLMYIALDLFRGKPPHIPAFVGGVLFYLIVMIPFAQELLF